MRIDERIADVARAHPGEPIDCYVLMPDHEAAFDLHEAARAAGLAARITPTPRATQACCGVSLLVGRDQVRSVLDVARRSDIAVEGVVPLPRQLDARRDRYC